MAQGSSSQVPASALQPPAMPRRPEPPAPRVGVELAAAVGTGTMSETELQRLERQTKVLQDALSQEVGVEEEGSSGSQQVGQMRPASKKQARGPAATVEEGAGYGTGR